MIDADLKKFAQEFAEGRMRMEGECGCGGKLIPHPWRRLVWICDRSHWWNRRKHAYLEGEVTNIEIIRRKPSE